jgi:hypothetical protein
MIVKVQPTIGRGKTLLWRVSWADGQKQGRFAPSKKMRQQVGDKQQAFYDADLIGRDFKFIEPVADQPW